MALLSSILGVFLCLLSFGNAQFSGQFGPVSSTSKLGDLPLDAYQPSPCDHEASARALRTLEYARTYIHQGLGKVPPLDPFTVDGLPRISLYPSFGDVTITGLRGEGAGLYKVKDVRVFLKSNENYFTVKIPIEKLSFNLTGDLPFGSKYYGSGELYLLNYTAEGRIRLVDHGCQRPNYTVGGIQIHTHVDQVDYDIALEYKALMSATPAEPSGAIEEIIQQFLDNMLAATANEMNKLLKLYSSELQHLLHPPSCYPY